MKTYVVVRKLDRDHYVIGYEATGEGCATSGSKYELMQYKTPVQRLDWFDEYTAYLQQVTDMISNTPRLQAVWEETVEVFTLSTGSDPDHLELFRVIKPTHQSLGSLINSAQMEGSKRISLALGLAQAVALAHQYGLFLVGLCPQTIAVRDDGSIVLRVVDWLRMHPGMAMSGTTNTSGTRRLTALRKSPTANRLRRRLTAFRWAASCWTCSPTAASISRMASSKPTEPPNCLHCAPIFHSLTASRSGICSLRA